MHSGVQPFPAHFSTGRRRSSVSFPDRHLEGCAGLARGAGCQRVDRFDLDSSYIRIWYSSGDRTPSASTMRLIESSGRAEGLQPGSIWPAKRDPEAVRANVGCDPSSAALAGGRAIRTKGQPGTCLLACGPCGRRLAWITDSALRAERHSGRRVRRLRRDPRHPVPMPEGGRTNISSRFQLGERLFRNSRAIVNTTVVEGLGRNLQSYALEFGSIHGAPNWYLANAR